jgi:hypothetical protein
MTTRDDIAAALSRVVVDWNGEQHALDGQPVRPAALAVWQAFPDWRSAVWLTSCVIERIWQVYVILPAGDPEAWATATDAALDSIRTGLLGLGAVTRVEPVALVAADQGLTMPALNFTLTT